MSPLGYQSIGKNLIRYLVLVDKRREMYFPKPMLWVHYYGFNRLRKTLLSLNATGTSARERVASTQRSTWSYDDCYSLINELNSIYTATHTKMRFKGRPVSGCDLSLAKVLSFLRRVSQKGILHPVLALARFGELYKETVNVYLILCRCQGHIDVQRVSYVICSRSLKLYGGFKQAFNCKVL